MLLAHSYYSLLEGLPSPAELAETAAQHGLPFLALTDHNLLTGAIEFSDACQAAGIRPIFGLDLDVSFPRDTSTAPPVPSRLTLLAQDLDGWASLCVLSSATQSRVEPTKGQPLIPFEFLVQNSRGLIALSGGSWGMASDALKMVEAGASPAEISALREAFGDRLYWGIPCQASRDPAQQVAIFAQAKTLGIPCAAVHPVYYLEAADQARARLVAAIRLNKRLGDVKPDELPPVGAEFLPAGELIRRYGAQFGPQTASRLIAAALELQERCSCNLPLGKPRFPHLELDSGLTPEAALRQQAYTAAQRLYGIPGSERVPFEIELRLEKELEMIGQLGYTSLFLIVAEILAYARHSGTPISSRGSAASSLVAHCLGITSPDPVRLNLYFERFLNPARATPPDIDTDLCSRRRDGVIQYVYDRFGADRVAMVCTINRFRPRSALRETAKAYGFSQAEVKRLADSLPYRWWRQAQFGESPYAEIEQAYPSARYQEVFAAAKSILGLPDHLSIHPGGVVISPGPLVELAPTALAAKGVIIAQFDLESIERLGLVKIDLLGIRGLTVLGDLAEAIAQQNPGKYGATLEVLEAIPEADEATAEAVRQGRTIGCFQIESPGMRLTLKEIQAHTIDDIMAALALYRPGPLLGGQKTAYVRRHRGLEQPSQLHPALGPVLEDTYGVILYQEQVLRIAHEVAGLSLADADLLRRAMSHFDPGKQMQTLKEKFVAGVAARHAIPAALAEKIWDWMAAFAGYGFPKAHAASYAVVAWRAAWCKTHYPDLFMAAVMANWGGYYSQRVYLTEARRLGLKIKPPHVNWARREFSVGYPEGQPVLYMGLDQVKELTRRTQERILRQRPFRSLADFLARVDPRPAEAELLIKAGALEGLGTIPQLLSGLTSRGRGGQMLLFSLDDPKGEISSLPEWTLAERLAAQEEILSAWVDAHPLELAAGKIAAAHAVSTLEAAGQLGKRVRVAGMRQTWRRSYAAQGSAVYFMALEDLEGMLNTVIPGNVYRQYKNEFSTSGPYILEGEVALDQDTGEALLRVEKAWRLE